MSEFWQAAAIVAGASVPVSIAVLILVKGRARARSAKPLELVKPNVDLGTQRMDDGHGGPAPGSKKG